ncbi:MAG: RcpC/CpaB family pilus assembly protein [Pirellulaceae bacterium]
MPPGHTVVTYNIGNDPGIANLVEPGDRINVIGFFEKSDIVPETTHRDVFRNVLIFAVDGRTTREPNAEEKRKSTSTILLLIKQEDERVWNWAKKVGSLQITLGNPNEVVDNDAPNAAGQEFMKWLDDYADLRRRQQIEPEAVEELPTKSGGETVRVLTPKGYRLFRWNKATKTMELIDELAPDDSELGTGGNSTGTPDITAETKDEGPSGTISPRRTWESTDSENQGKFYINRAR